MSEPLVPSVVVNICHQCVPQAGGLPRQWRQGSGLVVVRELPCTGKVDLQYLLHAVEEVDSGVCVVACPLGHCRLGQGNHRARIRLDTLRKLLAEIGVESQRAELVHCAPDDSPAGVERLVRDAAERILRLGPNPLRCAGASASEAPSTGDPRQTAPHRDAPSHAPHPPTTDGMLE